MESFVALTTISSLIHWLQELLSQLFWNMLFLKLSGPQTFLSDKNRWQRLSVGKFWLLSPSVKLKQKQKRVLQRSFFVWRFKTSFLTSLGACCATLIVQGNHGASESSWQRIFQSKEISYWLSASIHRAEGSTGQRMVESQRILVSCGISDL